VPETTIDRLSLGVQGLCLGAQVRQRAFCGIHTPSMLPIVTSEAALALLDRIGA
jgi:hypothetical protein